MPTAQTPRKAIFLPWVQIGLGPQAMRQVDVVVNINGSDVPLILRAHGSSYRFVGAAYIPESIRLYAIGEAEKEGTRFRPTEI
jgi:hypothetical protein